MNAKQNLILCTIRQGKKRLQNSSRKNGDRKKLGNFLSQFSSMSLLRKEIDRLKGKQEGKKLRSITKQEWKKYFLKSDDFLIHCFCSMIPTAYICLYIKKVFFKKWWFFDYCFCSMIPTAYIKTLSQNVYYIYMYMYYLYLSLYTYTL